MRATPELLKHVGRGARLARDLPRDEARELMRRIVVGEADPVQIGAFLIALRMKGESADELAGIAEALRAHAVVPGLAGAPADVDVDLHADGRAGRPTIAVAAACVAAALGVRVLLRGAFASPFQRNDAGDALEGLGLDPSRGVDAACRALERAGLGVVDVAAYAPRAAELLDLRARLGVRTCVQSAVKLLDPAGTGRSLVGIFHSPYHAPVAGALLRLGVRRAGVVQAAGGLPELAPDKPTRVTLLDERAAADAGGAPPAPVALAGGDAPLAAPAAAPLPTVDGAAALARLLHDVLHAPAAAPPGAVRGVILTAALVLWAAGHADHPHDPVALAAAADALARGAAARALADARVCYSE